MISKSALKRIREYFLDTFITIYLKDLNVITVNEEGQEIKISPTIDGLVIDVDDEYYYLGLPDGSVLRTIPHGSVGLVEVASSNESNLNVIDMPENDEDIH